MTSDETMLPIANLLLGEPLTDYLQLAALFPHLFRGDRAMEIVLNREHIETVQERERRFWLERGFNPANAWNWSRAGLIHFDPYLLWIRDVVCLQDGSYTLFKRILYTFQLQQGKGVAICGLTPGMEVVLVEIWRHAVQRWCLELPRGSPNASEASVDCARREFEEETGHRILSIRSLGAISPDTGVLGHEVEIFFAHVDRGTPLDGQQEDCIKKIHYLPLDKLNNSHMISEPFLSIALRWISEHACA